MADISSLRKGDKVVVEIYRRSGELAIMQVKTITRINGKYASIGFNSVGRKKGILCSASYIYRVHPATPERVAEVNAFNDAKNKKRAQVEADIDRHRNAQIDVATEYLSDLSAAQVKERIPADILCMIAESLNLTEGH